jgi:hypothetical protein
MKEPQIETGIENIPVYETPNLLSATVHPDLPVNKIALLAREMAMAIRDPETILRATGITQAQFDTFILTNDFYKRAYETFVLEWESALSTNKRIAIEAAASLEDALPDLSERMTDAKEPLNMAVETAKLFAKLAGAGEQNKEAGAGEQRFNIVINMGSQTVRLEETVNVKPNLESTNADLSIALAPPKNSTV